MKQCILILLISLFQSDPEIGQRLFPIVLKENLKLNDYNISKTYKLSDTDFVLIGKNKIQTTGNEGHRLLYLSVDSLKQGFRLKYISRPKDEAYVYNPYFFVLKDELIIVAEEGYEYMSGIDIYRLKNSKVEFLGYVPVAGKDRDSIVEQMKLERQMTNYKISFIGRIEYEIATDNIIDGSKLKVYIDKMGLRIIEE